MSTNRPTSCEHRYKNFKPLDNRPARGGYAQGEYFVKCRTCECGFTGDKRSYQCADCAYAGSNRPPSLDLPPEFYELKLKPCPLCGAEAERSSCNRSVFICSDVNCLTYGPWKDPHGRKWNSIPRRSEVLELIRLVDGYFAGKTDPLDLRICATKLREEIGE